MSLVRGEGLIRSAVSRLLTGYSYKQSYDSFEDAPVRDFFVPSLERAHRYDRAVGYFSGALLAVLADAFTDFSTRGGRMRLICSPILSFSDAQVFDDISKERLLSSLNESIDQLDEDGLMQPPLNLMAALLARGTLEVKFAVPHQAASGIFHQKIGLFEDEERNFVTFSGSNNESLAGWMDMQNSESFSVYTSWRDENDAARGSELQNKFERMWNNNYRGFEIQDFRKALQFVVRRETQEHDLEDLKSRVREWFHARHEPVVRDFELRPYQNEVLADWEANGHRGIVSFATGAGKTITALEACSRWRKKSDHNAVVILVPTVRLQKQWLDEIRKYPEMLGVEVLLVGGAAPFEHWSIGLREFTARRGHSSDGIVLAVNRSASAEAFASRISWGSHLMFVADEVHNMGAEGLADLLQDATCGAVLGLSATPERYNDDENLRVRQFFGRDLQPIVDIRYAQDLKVLVPYRYHYEKVSLDDGELEKYQELTRRIGAASGMAANSGDDRLVQRLKSQRANILKGAKAKVGVAADLIRKQFKKGSSWLVFCNDTYQLDSLKVLIKNLQPLDYHGASEGDKDQVLDLFRNEGGILLSIHMMDEGVDIPSIDHCLILASSQNKREFIQRRGRVLRVNKNAPKGLAEIWDLIVVDSDGLAFTTAEIDRAEEFARYALNRSIQGDLRRIARQT